MTRINCQRSNSTRENWGGAVDANPNGCFEPENLRPKLSEADSLEQSGALSYFNGTFAGAEEGD